MENGAKETRTFLICIALGFERCDQFLELKGVRSPVSVVIREGKTRLKIQQVGYLGCADRLGRVVD